MIAISDAKRHIGNLLGGAGFSILNLSIGVVTGLVLTPFLVTSLGTRYYGINEMITTFVGCFMLLDFGVDSAVSRFFTLHYARNERSECIAISNTAFFIFLLLGFLGAVGIISSAVVMYFLYPSMSDRLLFFHILLINGAAFGLNFSTKALVGVVNGTMNQHLTGSRDVFMRLLWTVLTFVVVYCGGKLYAISFVNLGIVILNMFIVWRLAKFVFPEFVISWMLFKVSLVRKLFSFAFSTFLVFIGDTVASRGGIFVIGLLLSIELVTPFTAVSVKLCEMYSGLMTTICGGWLMSWLTYLHANKEKELLDDSMQVAYKVSTYSSSFMYFGIVVWSYDFILRWMGAGMLVAYPCLLIVAAEHWIIFAHSPNTKYLFAVAKHHLLAYCNLVGAIVQIVLMIFFVNLGWGLTGVALGYLLASVPVRGLIIPIFVCRLRDVNFFKYYLEIISYMAIAAAACVIPYIITIKLIAPSYPRLFLIGFLSLITYAPVIFLIGFNKNEKQKIIGLITSRIKR
ncbi:MAG: hypothetical protein LBQ66_07355 [Planctomycetaceae bacterium]|jgi:O-antigen/teichoic acid export membrane protein|nr:hypothetical protein [Planctomycetaceae bacterium]